MKNILLVDDFQSNLLLIKNILSDEYNVTTTTSGEQAIKILRTKRIDLLVLDIWMPGMDGLSTLQMIRENSKIKDIPVILLTGQADRGNILRGHQLGVMDVLAKPVLPSLMRERIQKVFYCAEHGKKEYEDNKKAIEAEARKDKKNKTDKQKASDRQKPDEKKAVLTDTDAKEDLSALKTDTITQKDENDANESINKDSSEINIESVNEKSSEAESSEAESSNAKSSEAENSNAKSSEAESSKAENREDMMKKLLGKASEIGRDMPPDSSAGI